jgi:hypothetical protein
MPCVLDHEKRQSPGPRGASGSPGSEAAKRRRERRIVDSLLQVGREPDVVRHKADDPMKAMSSWRRCHLARFTPPVAQCVQGRNRAADDLEVETLYSKYETQDSRSATQNSRLETFERNLCQVIAHCPHAILTRRYGAPRCQHLFARQRDLGARHGSVPTRQITAEFMRPDLWRRRSLW